MLREGSEAERQTCRCRQQRHGEAGRRAQEEEGQAWASPTYEFSYTVVAAIF